VQAVADAAAAPARRMHLGCGSRAAAGWLNVDRRPLPGVDVVADVRGRLPLPDGALACVVANHVLQDLAWADVVPALGELRRVLRPGGVLRFAVPDLARAMEAFRRGDGRWFYVPDGDAVRPGAKLVTQCVWYGAVRTPFTWDFALESCERAGFARVEQVGFRETASGRRDLVAFDDRERESLHVEAWR
jgi:SAM-dependent methyltransferase